MKTISKKGFVIFGTGFFLLLLSFCILHYRNDFIFLCIVACLMIISAFLIMSGFFSIIANVQGIYQQNNHQVLEEQFNSQQKLLLANFSEIIQTLKITNSNVENISQFPELFDELSQKLIEINSEYSNNINTEFSTTNKYLMQSVDETSKNTKEIFNKIAEKIDYLSEDYKDDTTSFKNSINKMISELSNYEDTINSNLEESNKLYNGVSEVNEKIIKQLTLISENDVKVLKEILNDGI